MERHRGTPQRDCLSLLDVASDDSERALARRLFDEMPQLGWTARADGFIDYYNRGWYEYTGTKAEETMGWGWESVHDPALLPAVLAQWKHCVQTGEPFEAILQLRRHDGAFRWFLTRANPMRDAGGRIVRWVGVNTDIDDQRRAEEAAAAASHHSEAVGRQRLEDTVRVREDVLAMVSHDLRNPLNIVFMAAKQIELFVDDSESGLRSKRPVRLILKAAERMACLVSDLLDLSKLEAGRPIPLELETHDLVKLVREVAELFEPVARARELTLCLNVPSAIHVSCDGDRVHQVLSNLLGNAMKFTREGGSIIVGARIADGEVVISVSDTGTGIPAAQIPHLFAPYWQADPLRKGGAGLGLSIAKAIIDAHHARIWVDSIPGAGSTFHFTLPTTHELLAAEDER
jgi:PAS domain S-box-containing protein